MKQTLVIQEEDSHKSQQGPRQAQTEDATKQFVHWGHNALFAGGLALLACNNKIVTANWSFTPCENIQTVS